MGCSDSDGVSRLDPSTPTYSPSHLGSLSPPLTKSCFIPYRAVDSSFPLVKNKILFSSSPKRPKDNGEGKRERRMDGRKKERKGDIDK
mmetsp:Transcript_32218/g.63938  ORF Transcript_32218/g.63938 Transcript_32218/m.63938 type:complete len:88 (+) Transcript_32218:130-393(+)